MTLTKCDHVDPETLHRGGPVEYCDAPVQFYALSAEPPEDWSASTDAGASLAGFCCIEHANDELRPTLNAAKRVYGMVLEGVGCPCGNCLLDGATAALLRRLIDAYPDPVPA